ncbi:hypothetical protein J1614_006276 [Plenodomus biglobosus]|nr:hypothetical protein J1614_006276 [Plenodomus biglobosus]
MRSVYGMSKQGARRAGSVVGGLGVLNGPLGHSWKMMQAGRGMDAVHKCAGATTAGRLTLLWLIALSCCLNTGSIAAPSTLFTAPIITASLYYIRHSPPLTHCSLSPHIPPPR